MPPPTVLVVEDDPVILRLLEVNFQLEGFTVHTQLQEGVLRRIAELSGGAYFTAAAAEQLPAIYDEVAAQLVVKPEQAEITALFVGAGLLLLLAGGLLSLFWFSRMP